MENTFPQWTLEINDRTVVGEDQLGIEGPAQSYQQEILPGIITVTEHARYYSYYAWILYRYIFGKGSNRLVKDFRGKYFKRHEVALILSAYQHHKDGKSFSGVTGSGASFAKAKRFWGNDEVASLDQTYFVNPEGGFGQYYRTPMRAMGLLEEAEKPGWVYRLTEQGKELAEAYQDSITETNYFKNLEINGQLTSLSLQDSMEYGKVGCMCPEAISIGKDRKLLLDTFFRFDLPQDIKNAHVRRRNSLGVALDLVYQAKGKFNRDMLRPALYLMEYNSNFAYQPSLELIDWIKRWQLVEVRHLFTFGLQCLWAAFLVELDASVYIKRDDWQSWINNQLSKVQWAGSIKQTAEKICYEAGLSGGIETLLKTVPKEFKLSTGIDEYSLYLKAVRNQKNSKQLFVIGCKILVQLYLRFYQNFHDHDLIWDEMAQKQRISLNDYFLEMDKMINNPVLSMKDWVRWIYQDYIFTQHEMIALEKLRYQDYDTFKFYFEEDTFHWPVGKKPYREPIRLAGNRINNCLTMLIDLGLTIENEDGALDLSEDGLDYHAQVIGGLKNGN